MVAKAEAKRVRVRLKEWRESEQRKRERLTRAMLQATIRCRE